jgi:hypothetical protein
MAKKILKGIWFPIKYFLVFFFLGIPISDETIFDKLYDFTYPYTASSYNMMREIAERSSNSFKEFMDKVFSNSVPKEDDLVQITLHARRRDLEERNEELEKSLDD